MGSPIDSGGKDEEQLWAVLHLAFIYDLYEIRVRVGRYFLHTQSHAAKSWDQPTVVDFINMFPDMCQTVTDRDLFGVNTPTRWLTNSGCIVQALSTSNYQESKGKVAGKPAAPENPGTPGISEDSESHPPTVRQTMVSAMFQQL